MFNRLKVLAVAALCAAGLAGVATLAAAQNAPSGYDATTNLQGFPGMAVAIGTPPTTVGSTCASGTLTVTGGATTGSVATTVCTTLVLKLTWTIPALGLGASQPSYANGGYSQSAFPPTLHGVYCAFADLTHPATITQAATTYTAPTATVAGTLTCTSSSATITASDAILYTAEAY